MRSLVRAPGPVRRPRLRAQVTVVAVSLSACAAALLAGEPAPAVATQQIVIVNDLQAGQPAPTVVTPPPAVSNAAPVMPPLTASR
jgi:hypothetical protein